MPKKGHKQTKEHKRKGGIPKGYKFKNWTQKEENHWNWKGGNSSSFLKKQRPPDRPKPKNCEICKRKGRICQDHDHKTNKFRGWICTQCNNALGQVDDNIEILLALIDYLKLSKEEDDNLEFLSKAEYQYNLYQRS